VARVSRCIDDRGLAFILLPAVKPPLQIRVEAHRLLSLFNPHEKYGHNKKYGRRRRFDARPPGYPPIAVRMASVMIQARRPATVAISKSLRWNGLGSRLN
jgi:hypothetical protein